MLTALIKQSRDTLRRVPVPSRRKATRGPAAQPVAKWNRVSIQKRITHSSDERSETAFRHAANRITRSIARGAKLPLQDGKIAM